MRPDQISQSVRIQNRQKGLGRVSKSAPEHAGAFDPAIASPLKAANDVELVLGFAHHLAHIDVARVTHQPNAAVAATHCVEIALVVSLPPLSPT